MTYSYKLLFRENMVSKSRGEANLILDLKSWRLRILGRCDEVGGNKWKRADFVVS